MGNNARVRLLCFSQLTELLSMRLNNDVIMRYDEMKSFSRPNKQLFMISFNLFKVHGRRDA